MAVRRLDLERDPRPYLQVARNCISDKDLGFAEGAAIQVSVDTIEVCVIVEVEGFKAELHLDDLSDPHVFDQRAIETVEPRAAEYIPA